MSEAARDRDHEVHIAAKVCELYGCPEPVKAPQRRFCSQLHADRNRKRRSRESEDAPAIDVLEDVDERDYYRGVKVGRPVADCMRDDDSRFEGTRYVEWLR